jgi:hypothetical protein
MKAITMTSLQASGHSAASDFDFLFGRWHIRNRRLSRHFVGSQDWEQFDASSEARPLPGGIGNIDSFEPQGWRPGFVGGTLRSFNPKTGLWSLFWLSNIDGGVDGASGQLHPPVVGRFDGAHGQFFGAELLDGQPIRVRFDWYVLGPDQARWEQSFSRDKGQSWELNWVMEMRRQQAA